MSDHVKNRVVELFGEGKLYCAETVLAIIAEAGGKDPDGTLWQMSDVVERIRVIDAEGEFRDLDADEFSIK